MRKTLTKIVTIIGVVSISTLMASPVIFAVKKPLGIDRTANNLGVKVNSPAKDLGPIISADGNSLYFTSDRAGGKGGQDIWVSKRVGGTWSEPVNLGEPLNTAGDEGPDTFSHDEKTLYLTAMGRKDSRGGSDIYYSKFKDGKWGEPKNLGRNINSKHDEANASLSADGKRLYFSSNRPGGLGAWDIWVSKRTKRGWSRPKNLGKDVNSTGWETNAFIHPDGVTLYFASNGRGGYGGSDIFKATLVKGRFTEAINLGGSMNTEENDTYFTVPGSGDLAYFSSDLPGGMGQQDIYAVPMPSSLRPKSIAVLKGKVLSRDGDKPIKAKIMIKSIVGKNIAHGWTGEDGSFKISILPEKDLTFKVDAKGYTGFYEYLEFDLKKLVALKEYSIKLDAK